MVVHYPDKIKTTSKIIPKLDITFLVDRSGSMSGTKINQTVKVHKIFLAAIFWLIFLTFFLVESFFG